MKHIDSIRAGIEREEADGYHVVVACEEDCEGWFSWRLCELCQDHHGGERHSAALIKPGKSESIKLTVCICCLGFLANRDECNCYERAGAHMAGSKRPLDTRR